jgi:hypothetical protein
MLKKKDPSQKDGAVGETLERYLTRLNLRVRNGFIS